MVTQRLYYADSYLRQFRAQVVALGMQRGRAAVALDQSVFYPEGGGQPADHGTIAGCQVIDVQSDTAGVVWHILAQPHEFEVGALVEGEIDWARRFDHMQQHHGQHLLSAAFEQLYGFKTISFHLGVSVVTIDLSTPELVAEQASAVEAQANQNIWKHLPVLARFVNTEELAGLTLRKPPSVDGPIRVVSVPDVDHSACGGTHPSNTGGVGLLHIRRWERRGDAIRVEFACGGRVVRDLHTKHGLVTRLSTSLSIGPDELESTITRIRESEDRARKALEEARSQLLHYEAATLVSQAEEIGEAQIVTLLSVPRSLEELRTLAQLIAAQGCVAILGMANEKGHLIIARGTGVPHDSNAILKAALAPFGGRGGGRAEMAQGGIADASQVAALLERAREALKHHPEGTRR